MSRNEKTVFFIGAGCVVDSWDPIRQVLSDRIFSNSKRLGDNESLALVAYQEEAAIANIILNLFDLTFAPSDYITSNKKILSCLQEWEEVLEIKEEIAKIFQKSKFSLHKDTNRLLDKYGLFDTSGNCVFTTNWDLSLGIQRTTYLHGDCRNHYRMILPTNSNAAFAAKVFALGSLLASAYKTKKLSEDLNIQIQNNLGGTPDDLTERATTVLKKHNCAYEKMKECDRLIIAGTGLHAYDAEILSLLNKVAQEINTRAPEITLIDTIDNGKKMENKLAGLLNVHPERINTEFVQGS